MRQRLFRLLDRRGAGVVTWICGPPGAGKTTLVASFVAAHRRSHLWYQVDPSDTDPATVFYHLTQAAPKRPVPLPLLTPELRAGLSAFTRRYFRDLYARLRAPFVLVLDNYHELPPDAPLHELLRDAVEELPAGGRIIAISRMAPPPSLARLRVHGAIDLIEWTHLRLTLGEARQIASRRARGPVSLPEVRRLHELTDGWTAGFVLMLASPAAERSPGVMDAPEVLFDYFAGEIFDRADPRVQDVLLRTSFLPAIRAESATALTGDPDAAAIVDDLHRNGYFTNRGASADAPYQYHPLYQAFLQNRAASTFSPGGLAEVRAAAARIAEDAGEVDSAATLFRTSRDWSALAGLVERQSPRLLAQGRADTVDTWLSWLPGAIVDARPWLLCWRAVCRLGRLHRACRSDAEAALVMFRDSNDLDGALLSWSTVVTSFLMEGDLEPLDTWIPLLDELLRESPGEMSDAVEARVAPAMLLAIFYRQPAHPDGARWAERALTSTRRCPDAQWRAVAAFGWVFYQWVAGDPAKAPLVVEEMRALQTSAKVSPLVALYASVPVIWHEFMSGSPRYQKTLVAALEIARANGLDEHMLVASVLTAGTLAALSDDDVETGRACLDQLSARLGQVGGTYTVACHSMAIRLGMAEGSPGRVSASIREFEREARPTGFPLDPIAAHGTLAYLYCERGDFAAAQTHARQTVCAARLMATDFAAWMAHAIEAHVLFACGRHDEGLTALHRTFQLGRAAGYVNSQLWMPSMMAGLCARALEAGIEVEYVRGLIARRGLERHAPSSEVEAWPWPIRIVTRGRLSVTLDDRPLTWTGKLPRRTLALLERLIDRGPGGARDEVLMDQLWPDAEGDAARRALATAVFRLRRMLGHEEAVVRADGVTRLDARRCWVDVWAIDRLLERAQGLSESDPRFPDRGVAWIERAATLYGAAGDTDDDSRDSDHRGERLARQMLRVARYRERAGELARALRAQERILAAEPARDPRGPSDRLEGQPAQRERKTGAASRDRTLE